jgi:hypothetical protein
MNKGLLISYFDKIQKKKYISSSITQLAVKLGIHRNTLSNWLKDGYYEDGACLVFRVESNEFINRSRKKEAPGRSIDTIGRSGKNVQYTSFIAHKKTSTAVDKAIETFIDAGED